jgi:hypothetical protein
MRLQEVFDALKRLLDRVLSLLQGRWGTDGNSVSVPAGGKPRPNLQGGTQVPGVPSKPLKTHEFSENNILPMKAFKGYLENFNTQNFLLSIGSVLATYKFDDWVPSTMLDPFLDDSFVRNDLDYLVIKYGAERYLETPILEVYQKWKRDMELSGESFAVILDTIAKQLDLNQKFMLATVQKEQSLLYKKTTSDVLYYKTGSVKYEFDAAYGCGYLDDGTIIPRFRGIKRQIIGAAWTFSNRASEWVPGTSIKTISGGTVTPENACTWACYRYTPHVYAQQSLHNIYKTYFPEELYV